MYEDEIESFETKAGVDDLLALFDRCWSHADGRGFRIETGFVCRCNLPLREYRLRSFEIAARPMPSDEPRRVASTPNPNRHIHVRVAPDDIRKLLASGPKTMQQMQREFGVSHTTIRKNLHRMRDVETKLFAIPDRKNRRPGVLYHLATNGVDAHVS